MSTFLREHRSQPELLRSLARRPFPFEDLSEPRRTLVGCGDMHFAACVVEWWARCNHDDSVHARRSMDLRYLAPSLGPKDLVVVASVSGRTPRSLEALLVARQHGARTLALTDDPGSPLARAAERTFVLGTATPTELDRPEYAGYSSEVPQTRSFVAALGTLLALALRDPERHRAALSSAAEELEWAIRAERGAVPRGAAPRGEIVLLGSGPLGPVAQYGAAKLLEYALPARAQCIEEFAHLEMFVADERTTLVALLGDDASAERFAELREPFAELGVRLLEFDLRSGLALHEAPLGPVFRGIATVQRLAHDLAANAGRDLERWVGGVRRDQIFDLSNRTVRRSALRRYDSCGSGSSEARLDDTGGTT